MTIEADEAAYAMHPVTLSFVRPEVERAFWTSFARGARGFAQFAAVLLFTTWLLFGVVDWWIFPESFGVLAVIRFGVVAPMLALVLPVPFVPGLERFFERWIQEVILYCAAASTGGLFAMGPWVTAEHHGRGMHTAALGVMTAMTFVYGFTRLRFAYVVPLGLAASVATGWYLVRIRPDTMLVVNLALFSVAFNAVGGWVSRELEVNARREFVDVERLARARARSDALLCNVLPAEIAARVRADIDALTSGARLLAERHEDVTVVLADLVGFTPLSERLAPADLAAMLDRLFSRFDVLCERHGVEKIKTLGDAWLAAAGVPTHRPDHAGAAAALALDMLAAVGEMRDDLPAGLSLRVGVHTGSAVAGVIGRTRFAYDLWGDAVAGAADMEHRGEPGRARVSPSTAARLGGKFVTEQRAEPGGGHSVWLVGRVADGA